MLSIMHTFPSQINNNTTLTLCQMIQREFRNAQENTNINLALFILKLLNQKLCLANDVLQLCNYCDNSLSEEINNNDDDKCWNVVEDTSSMTIKLPSPSETPSSSISYCSPNG